MPLLMCSYFMFNNFEILGHRNFCDNCIQRYLTLVYIYLVIVLLIFMSQIYIRCSNLSGWILRTVSTRETRTIMTLFKSLVLSWLDYASQLWSPHLLKSVYLLENDAYFVLFFLSCHYILLIHWKTHSFAVSLYSIKYSVVPS